MPLGLSVLCEGPDLGWNLILLLHSLYLIRSRTLQLKRIAHQFVPPPILIYIFHKRPHHDSHPPVGPEPLVPLQVCRREHRAHPRQGALKVLPLQRNRRRPLGAKRAGRKNGCALERQRERERERESEWSERVGERVSGCVYERGRMCVR